MQKIILLHGALGTKSDFDGLSEKLDQLGFMVYNFSFSGHGKVPFSEKFGIEEFSSELLEFIKENDLKGCLVLGYSMGGYVALLSEGRWPGLFIGIITLGTKFNWTPEVIEKESAACNKEFLAIKAPAFLSLLEEKHIDADELFKRTAQMIKNFAGIELITNDLLQKIKIPVLIGRGDRDKLVNIEETLDVNSNLSDGGIFILPHTRHELNTVSISLLAQIISDFLIRNRKKTSGK